MVVRWGGSGWRDSFDGIEEGVLHNGEGHGGLVAIDAIDGLSDESDGEVGGAKEDADLATDFDASESEPGGLSGCFSDEMSPLELGDFLAGVVDGVFHGEDFDLSRLEDLSEDFFGSGGEFDSAAGGIEYEYATGVDPLSQFGLFFLGQGQGGGTGEVSESVAVVEFACAECDSVGGEGDGEVIEHGVCEAFPAGGFGVPVAGVLDSGDVDGLGRFFGGVGFDEIGLAFFSEAFLVDGVLEDVGHESCDGSAVASGEALHLPSLGGIGSGEEEHEFSGAVSESEEAGFLLPLGAGVLL